MRIIERKDVRLLVCIVMFLSMLDSYREKKLFDIDDIVVVGIVLFLSMFENYREKRCSFIS